MSYMWSIGINGTLINFLVPPRPAGYGFSTTGVGLIYFAPITGIIMAELFGHVVSNPKLPSIFFCTDMQS